MRKARASRVELEAKVTELERQIAQLQQLARTDPLTGLANRREFDRLLRREYQRLASSDGPALSLLFLDVDFFKKFNDRFGHCMGDNVLRQVGRALRSGVRSLDSVAVLNEDAARFGGEEFVLVLPDTDEAGAMIVAERVRQRVAAIRVAVDGGQVGVTVSIGLRTHRPADSGSLESLVEEANAAMRRAKALGRDRVIAYETIGGGDG